MTSTVHLHAKLRNPQQFVTLYGTTPPRADAAPEAIERAATRLAERARQLPIDGLIVYDVQDEQERTTEVRPFPFLPTLEPRCYAQQVQELSGFAAITYKCVSTLTPAGWHDWLSETSREFGIRQLTLVGASTPNPPPGTLFVDQALQIAKVHEEDFLLGGVVIAERHTPSYNESQRLLHKAEQGCAFFVSQVVYHAEATIRLLADYAEDCRRQGVAPKRIVLTFSPCGRPKTMVFLKWLGVAISPETERAILDDAAPFAKSIQICCENLHTILDQAASHQIPLGVNIESVSIHKDEIEASVELVHQLHAVMQGYRQ